MFSCFKLGNIMQEMIDTIGAPEFYVTKIGKTEAAGGGCVRVYLCIERGNMLLTQFTVVMPALAMLEAAQVSQAAALEVFDCCRAVVGAVH